MTARLKDLYQRELVGKLVEELGCPNSMAVPRLVKIVLNMGVGEAVDDKKILEHAQSDLTLISGQKPLVTMARKSVAGFKIRAGWPIGCKVTLRRERMYEFLDRLINMALPRVRDFRGFSTKSADNWGNFSLGIREQIVFPEIDYDKTDRLRGMDVTIVTTARNKTEVCALLSAFGFPLIQPPPQRNSEVTA